jgi:hypothetical protein
MKSADTALLMRAIIMVKIRLIVKRAAARSANARTFALYFRLAFILSKSRAIMVNGFRIAHMNPVLSGIAYNTKNPVGGR